MNLQWAVSQFANQVSILRTDRRHPDLEKLRMNCFRILTIENSKILNVTFFSDTDHTAHTVSFKTLLSEAPFTTQLFIF